VLVVAGALTGRLGAYAVGSVALPLVVAFTALAPAGRAGPLARAVDGRRGLHDGRPGDYVGCTVAGAALLGVLSAVLLRPMSRGRGIS
jgi:hypothetical protein